MDTGFNLTILLATLVKWVKILRFILMCDKSIMILLSGFVFILIMIYMTAPVWVYVGESILFWSPLALLKMSSGRITSDLMMSSAGKQWVLGPGSGV